MEQEASPTTPIDNEVKKKKLKKSILRIVIGTVLLGCIGLGYVEYKHQDIINIRRIEFPDILEEMPMLTPQQIAIQNENYEKFKKNEMSVPCEEVKLLMSCSKRSECITLEENGQRCFGHECSGKKLVSCTSMPKEQYDKEIVQLNNCKDTGGYWYSG